MSRPEISEIPVVILCGGKGTRLREETEVRPKPMVEIGGMPILWHIMMHYHGYGFRDFSIALGYKSEVIKRWFVDMAMTQGSLQVSMTSGIVDRDLTGVPDWKVNLLETGLETNTGGRIKAMQPALGNETFMLTWGDGVSNVDLNALLAFHKSHGKLATMTVVRPPARFGQVEMDGDQILSFREKPEFGEGWINGAFFVLEPGVFDYISGPDILFEKEPLEGLARDGQLMAYKHTGFWQCMDALRDKLVLEKLWETGDAPWVTWRNGTCESLSLATADM